MEITNLNMCAYFSLCFCWLSVHFLCIVDAVCMQFICSLYTVLKTTCSFILSKLHVVLSLDDEWPESIFHHVGSQSASYLLSVL